MRLDFLPRVSLAASAVTVLWSVFDVAGSGAQQRPISVPDTPVVLDRQVRVVTVAKGLSHPMSIAFLPDGHTMLVVERSARLRIIRDGVLDPQPVSGLPKMNTFYMGGLQDVALHPQFATSHLVYFTYTKEGEHGVTLAVGRGRLNGASLTDVSDVLVTEAWEPTGGTPTSGDMAPYCGRMLFAPDGTLFVTISDRATGADRGKVRTKAQNLDNHRGKLLHLNDDGSAPKNNPFVNKPGARSEVYAYGFRNPYGLAFDPVSGALWLTDIGPLGGDEGNIIVPGGNYGWPLVTTGRDYTGEHVSDQWWWRPGMIPPEIVWEPAIAPSGIMFYTGDKFPRWKGNLFVSALVGKQVQRIVFNARREPIRPREPLLTQLGQRFRDVRQSPDGYIYALTEGLGMLGENTDGAVLRMEPAE